MLTLKVLLLLSAAAAATASSASAVCGNRTVALEGLSGVVVSAASGPEYASAVLNWNASPLIEQQVACVVVFCQTPGDVAAAITWARANGVPLAVRSGRHSYEGFSLSSGLIIDLSLVNATVVLGADPESSSGASLVSVGAGARLVDVYLFAAAAGLVFPGGSCPTVGVGGFTLGGGFGLSSRLVGLAIDSLVSVEFVTAFGEIVVASATEEQELFWALRGGGNGNFGVATSFVFSLQPLPSENVTIIELNWANQTAEVKALVIGAWTEWVGSAPRTVTSELTVYHHSVAALALFWGTPEDAAALCAELAAAAGGATTATFSSVSYLDAMLNFAGCDTPAACAALAITVPSAASPLYWKAKSLYAMSPLHESALSVIGGYLNPAAQNCCTGFSGLILDSYGGAIADVAETATAFPHRRAAFHMQIMVYFASPAQAAGAETWALEFGNALAAELGPRRSYRNYPDTDLGPGFADAYWGLNLPRLIAAKRKLDPENLFSYAQSVPSKPA